MKPIRRTTARRAPQDPRLIGAAHQLAETLSRMPNAAGNAPRALLVGGFVRDLLLGQVAKDADIEVFGVSPERLEDLLRHLFPSERVNTVGRQFGVFKVCLADDLELDVALPRRESKTAPGHRGFAVVGDPTMSFEEAARRRDFTVNAMSYDPLTAEIIDPFHGQEDLQNGILRAVDAGHFGEDPLRVYRALGFVARFGLSVDSSTLELMRALVLRGELHELPKERITAELRKWHLRSPAPSIGWKLADELRITQTYFPELDAIRAAPVMDGNDATVWMQTLEQLDRAATILGTTPDLTEDERLSILFGVLCHDLGKAAAGGHEASAVAASRWFSHFSFGSALEADTRSIIREQSTPRELALALDHATLDEAGLVNEVRKLVKRLHPLHAKPLLIAVRAIEPPGSIDGCLTLLEQTIIHHRLEDEPTATLLSGRDLVELGLAQGPNIGEWIRRVEELRDTGAIKTKAEALAWLNRELNPTGTA